MWDEAVRERTVKRFLECEAKRAKAQTAALKQSKSRFDTYNAAHRAAKAHWNAWADEMLAKKNALDESGLWVAERDIAGKLQPKNPQTRAWMDLANSDFSRCLFHLRGTGISEGESAEEKEEGHASKLPFQIINCAYVDLSEYIFPGDVSFESSTIGGNAYFIGAAFESEATFKKSTFKGEARFSKAIFKGSADFNNATFEAAAFFDAKFLRHAWFSGAVFEDALFDGATFEGRVDFEKAKFKDLITFRGATINDQAQFHLASFKGEADFDDATFKDAQFVSVKFMDAVFFGGTVFNSDASFSDATFSSYAMFNHAGFLDEVSFEEATFSKYTSFRDAKFGSKLRKADADFTAVKVERAFDLSGAYFSKVPSFCQADFKQAPDLDGVDFPLPDREPAVIGDPDLIPKYRAIRRMAIQGADYESEHKAFKGELRSRRWRIDKWWHPSAWLGVLYDGIADCGRSITQPAIAWAATIIVFAAFYGSRALAGAEARCADGGGVFVQALYLSAKNGLVLFAGTRDARVNQAYECLYGGSADQPHIPPSVTFVETLLQFPISAVLIFLGLLAVKNRFKIK